MGCPDRDVGTVDEFVRRGHHLMVNKNGRTSKKIFRNHPEPDCFSVHWASCSTVEETVFDYPNHGVVIITAQDSYELGQSIRASSRAGNDSHCDIIGEKPVEGKEQFAAKSQWVKDPISSALRTVLSHGSD